MVYSLKVTTGAYLPEISTVEFLGMESSTTLCATTLMVYTVPLCSPLSTVLVAVAGSSSGVEPMLGTAVTVYPVTGGLLSGSVGGVHVTVMDEPEVAMAVRLAGGGGAEWGGREHRNSCQKYEE